MKTNNWYLAILASCFFEDPGYTRISGTLENVGSTDWMPPWAMRRRIEDINSSFDVFSLGKVIWAMVSGKPFLNLWYHREPGNNIEAMFPDIPEMRLLNGLLDKCIVERERDCLKNARLLLYEIDDLLKVLELGGDRMSDTVRRSCKVCGTGIYNLHIDRDRLTTIRNFGLEPKGSQSFKVFVCDNCGHVQLFSCLFDSDPAGWTS